MDKKKTVKDFVNEYNKFSSDALKQNYLKSVVVVDKYVSFLVKCGLAETIISQSHYDGQGKAKLNSSKKYLLYITSLLEMYTNLDIQQSNAIENYDLLNKNGLLEPLLGLMPPREVKEFETIVQMYSDDDNVNYSEIHHFISNEVMPKIADITSPVVKKIESLMEKIAEDSIVEQVLEKINDLK